MGPPHSEDGGTVAEAEATESSTPEEPLGRIGKQLDRRSPFFIGLAAAPGVAVTHGLIQLLVGAAQILILIGQALLLAIDMEFPSPGSPGIACPSDSPSPQLAGSLPPPSVIVEQATALVTKAPEYLHQVQDHHTFLGRA